MCAAVISEVRAVVVRNGPDCAVEWSAFSETVMEMETRTVFALSDCVLPNLYFSKA